MRNSLSYQQFDILWNNLLSKFPDAAPYLNLEGQNAIIKNSVNSSTSLINLEKHINEQINRASTLVQYKSWIHSVTGSTLIHASSEFSPDIDKWITTYLTPASLSMQRQEISQAIWYTSQRVDNFQELGLQFDLNEQSNLTEQSEQSDLDDIFNVFVEDCIDAPATLIKELIPSTKVDSIQTREHPFIIGMSSTETSSSIEQAFPDLSFRLPDVSFSDIHAKVNHRKAYVTVNGLSKKAIQIGLDAGNHVVQELQNFMNGFINKYAPKSKEKIIQKRNIRQLEYKDETTCSSSSDKENSMTVKNPLENSITVENPLVNSKRGAPKKKQFKGSNKPGKSMCL
ncbi:3615_t:CDS:2, partial [Gigaspora rosea]